MTITRKLKSEFMGVVGQDLIDAPFTTIQNRAKINQSFQPVFGNERVVVNSISKVINEFGSNGETVWETDKADSRIRFVGAWYTGFHSSGMVAGSLNTASSPYAEVTFYGTYLNILGFIDGLDRSFDVVVDSDPSFKLTITGSNILNARNVKPNSVINVTKDLVEGWHTVRLVNNYVTTNIYAFEFGNTSTDIKILKGNAFVNGYQFNSDAIFSTPYNTGFENVLDANIGTKGGKAVVYIDPISNQFKKVFTPVNATTKYMSDTDFSNSKLTRIINWREFGRNRSDDFESVSGGTVRNVAFTLDDGSTTLVGKDVANNNISTETIDQVYPTGVTDFIVSTFTGSGLAVNLVSGGGGNLEMVIEIDGIVRGTITNANLGNDLQTVFGFVSDLGYGSHAFKITWGASNSHNVGITDFYIYEPKQAVIPEGALKICEYNILADFVFNSGTTSDDICAGTLFKANIREVHLLGPWHPSVVVDTTQTGGINTETNGAGASLEYNFVGDTIVFNAISHPTYTNNVGVEIDGSTDLSGFTVNVAGGISVLASNPFLFTTASGSGVEQSKLSISGLGSGRHTIKILNNTSIQLHNNGFNLTPLTYSNNTSNGSNSIQDLRNFESGKVLGELKSYNQAVNYNSVLNSVSMSRGISQLLQVSTGVVNIYYENVYRNREGHSTQFTADGNQNWITTVSTGFIPKHMVTPATQNTGGSAVTRNQNMLSASGILEKDVLDQEDN